MLRAGVAGVAAGWAAVAGCGVRVASPTALVVLSRAESFDFGEHAQTVRRAVGRCTRPVQVLQRALGGRN